MTVLMSLSSGRRFSIRCYSVLIFFSNRLIVFRFCFDIFFNAIITHFMLFVKGFFKKSSIFCIIHKVKGLQAQYIVFIHIIILVKKYRSIVIILLYFRLFLALIKKEKPLIYKGFRVFLFVDRLHCRE